MDVLAYWIIKPLMQYVAILLQPCCNFFKMLGSQKNLQFLPQFSTFLWSYLCFYNTHMHLLIHFVDFIKERYFNIYIY